MLSQSQGTSMGPIPEPASEEPGLLIPSSGPLPQTHSYSHCLLIQEMLLKIQSESLWFQVGNLRF